MHEHHVLKNICRDISSPKQSVLTKKWFTVILWFGVAFFVFALLQVGARYAVDDIWLIMGGLIVGAFIGTVMHAQSGLRAWAFLKPHVNEFSVKQRLNELEHNHANHGDR